MRKIITLSAFLLCSTQLQAVDRTWLGNNSMYNDPVNWGGTVPTPTDRAILPTPLPLSSLLFTTENRTIMGFRVDADTYTLLTDGTATTAFNIVGTGIENTNGSTFSINNIAANTLNFSSGSTAGRSVIGNGDTAQVTFNDSSNAGTSTINNVNVGAQLFFNQDSSAAESIIDLRLGTTTFGQNSTAGTSKITNTAGTLNFNERSQAPGACVINAAGGLVRIANRTMPTTPFELGSLTGAGNVQANGSNAILSVGHKNLNDTFSGNFLDNGQVLSVTKAGTGTMTITGQGHDFTGPLSVSEGTLQWDGNDATAFITSGSANAANIGPNGTLSGAFTVIPGAGRLFRNITNMGGVIAPGNPANPNGLLTIFDYAGTGTLCMSISPDQAPIILVPNFARSSILGVQDADFTGTTLALKLNPGRYDTCPRFFITIPASLFLSPSANPSVITLPFVNITGLTPRITATVTNGQPFSLGLGTAAILTLKEVPFVDIIEDARAGLFGDCPAGTGNSDQISLAMALDDPNDNADFNDVIGQINLFDCPQILEALNQLGNDGFNNNNNFFATEMITNVFSDGFESGDTSAWSSAVPYSTAYRPGVAAQTFRTRPQKLVASFRPSSHKRSFRDAALDYKDRLGVHARDQVRTHIRDNPGTGHVWVQGFGAHADAKTTLQDIGYRGDTYGVMLGVDYQSSADFRYGGAAGYSESTVDLNTKLGKAQIHSPFAAFWGHYMVDAYDFDFGLTARRNDHDNKRFITFLAQNRTANGKHKGYDLFPYVQVARHIALAEDVSLKPFVGLDFFHAHENAFTEKGAGGLNLRVKARNSSLVQSRLGAGLDQHKDWDCFVSRHAIAVSYKTRKPLGKQKTVSTFIGGTTPFVSTGSKKTHHRFGVNGDLSFLWDNGASIKASYHGDFGRNQSAHMGLVSIGKSW